MLPRPPLALSLAGLDLPGGPRAMIDWAAAAGFRAVQLDAAGAGLRPRELDRSARRDLAAILRRSCLVFTGLDLWIPPEHLRNPAKSERALEAILGAAELAADLVRHQAGPALPSVSLVFPGDAPPDIARAVASAAARAGVRIADHAIEPSGQEGFHRGVDPAALLQANQDPGAVAARAGLALASARFSDASLAGRVKPGAGRLDVTAYLASLSVAGYTRPLVLDARGVSAHDLREIRESW
jgi:sugar phosphate isomerase/epimerase